MNNANIDRILENMFNIVPVFHKKLLKMDIDGVTRNITRLQFPIMGILSQQSMTMSELAKMLMTTKPQMTHLVDQLVAMGTVERHPDKNDRRVINLVLTEEGSRLLGDVRKKVKENIKNRLSKLTPEELAEMSDALEKLRNIGTKL